MPERCHRKDSKNVPTWMLGDVSGTRPKRRYRDAPESARKRYGRESAELAEQIPKKSLEKTAGSCCSGRQKALKVNGRRFEHEDLYDRVVAVVHVTRSRALPVQSRSVARQRPGLLHYSMSSFEALTRRSFGKATQHRPWLSSFNSLQLKATKYLLRSSME